MAKHILDEFEDKARARDGQFAIAYALLRLERDELRLNRVGFP